MAAKTVKLPAALQPVEDLLLWRDVPKSAVALGVITALYVLLEWSGIPLLTMLSNIGLFGSLACLVWALAARPLGMPGPSDKLPAVMRSGVDEAAAKQLAEKLRGHLNKALALLAAFVLPKVYEMRKDDVDAGLETARSHAERQFTSAKVKVEEVVSPAATFYDELTPGRQRLVWLVAGGAAAAACPGRGAPPVARQLRRARRARVTVANR
ncbi:MAG: hypothetical protein J3K34DRAFT_260805 [Monoraphidium minutum]|nr:MAG: hypothetical protein J3K34DRAFT_260805 [Monoraphidium minutum]